MTIPIAAGVAIGKALLGKKKRPRRPGEPLSAGNIRAIEFLTGRKKAPGTRPYFTGGLPREAFDSSVSPEDEAFAERAYGRSVRGIGVQREYARAEAIRRALQLGYGSPATERQLGAIDTSALLAREAAGEGRMNLLDAIRNRNLGYQRGFVIREHQADLDARVRSEERRDRQNSEFWNAATEFFPQILDFFGSGGGSSDYNPENEWYPGKP